MKSTKCHFKCKVLIDSFLLKWRLHCDHGNDCCGTVLLSLALLLTINPATL